MGEGCCQDGGEFVGGQGAVQRLCTLGYMTEDCTKIQLRSTLSQCVYTRTAEPDGVLGDSRLGDARRPRGAALRSLRDPDTPELDEDEEGEE